jgi:hypothetical protein
MTLKDPKARLVAELALRCRRLQEQFPGTPALAMSRKQAQSGCRLWPHQLLQANQHPDARYVSHKTTISRRDIRSVGIFSKVSRLANIGTARKTCKNKILLYEHLRMPSGACPQQMLLRNKSKGMILPCMQFTS